LLRMTTPRSAAARVEAVFEPSVAEVASVAEATEVPATESADAAEKPEQAEILAADPVEPSEVEQLADELRQAGEAARKIAILGSASGASIALTALALARLMARHANVALVDLSGSSRVVSEASVDPSAPGLAELMLGEASFSQIITRDRLSRVQLVNSGRPGSDRTLLRSPRLALAIDALLRVYDHVLLDVGVGSDLSAEMLTSRARAIFVPDALMTADARAVMCDHLEAVGFSEAKMLREAATRADVAESGARVAA
jgi:polysaccharide biosynthesis transport protein